MDIYKLNNKRLNSVESVNFESEKEIQSIVEHNSKELFDLTFVKSEVVCENFRFDSFVTVCTRHVSSTCTTAGIKFFLFFLALQAISM